MADPDYPLLAAQAAQDHQSANVRYRKALRDSQHYAFSELVFTAAAADLTHVSLEPSDQGDYMTVQSLDVDDDVMEALEEGAMDLADTIHSHWAGLPGVDYEDSRRNGDRATIDIQVAAAALLTEAEIREGAQNLGAPYDDDNTPTN